ncbi:hypothetical protein EON65_44960 [archaeon]|nr:MAG: hypothetical protein EON65_44960 [archaeon]
MLEPLAYQSDQGLVYFSGPKEYRYSRRKLSNVNSFRECAACGQGFAENSSEVEGRLTVPKCRDTSKLHLMRNLHVYSY